MTPEREREIRKIAGRDGQTWRSSAVSLVALNEVLDELDRLRGAADAMRVELVETLKDGDPEKYACDKAFKTVLTRGRELGLWK